MNRAREQANRHAERCRELADILIPALREIGRRCGYAIGVHGSLAYDIDLIAAPWREGCISAQSFADYVKKACEIICGQAFQAPGDKQPEQRPHGRLAWSFHLGGGPYVDLSIMPQLKNAKGLTPQVRSSKKGSAAKGD